MSTKNLGFQLSLFQTRNFGELRKSKVNSAALLTNSIKRTQFQGAMLSILGFAPPKVNSTLHCENTCKDQLV